MEVVGFYATSHRIDLVRGLELNELSRRETAAVGSRLRQVICWQQDADIHIGPVRRKSPRLRRVSGFDPCRPYEPSFWWSGLIKNARGKRGQIVLMIRFVDEFSAARVTLGLEESRYYNNAIRLTCCVPHLRSRSPSVLPDGSRLAAILASSAVQRYNHSHAPGRCP